MLDTNTLRKNSDLTFELPKALNEAIEISKKIIQNLIISRLEYEQSEKDVTIARSDLSPSASLSLIVQNQTM